jgi:glycosyltransferase involved in cell wall biosynthesis
VHHCPIDQLSTSFDAAEDPRVIRLAAKDPGIPMSVTVIVPAFNEEAGISRVLSGLNPGSSDLTDIEVVVAANGCTDQTASVAREFGVTVIEIAEASKTAALNAAEAVATSGHRIYLDADAVVSPALIRSLADSLSRAGIEAAVPRPHLVYGDSSWPVRAYYRVSERLPVFRNRLFGRGVIALSENARGRFERFPDITADDMFLDAIVGADEKVEIDVEVPVTVPRRTRQLVRRLARAREGNVEFWRFVRSAPDGYRLLADPVPGPSSWSWLRSVVLREPRLAPAAACYVAIVVLAELRRRRAGFTVRSGWGREAGASVRPA